MKKESSFQDQVYNARVNDTESVWQFKYDKGDVALDEQYSQEFRDKLESEGYFKIKNLIARTGLYREVINDAERGETISGNKHFLSFYQYKGSFIVEGRTYLNSFLDGNKYLEPSGLKVNVSLKTLEGTFYELKHSQLEKELNEIIRRD
ncbi:MAG: hypothetical protein PF542_00890 [Nanoarchaeota archaeon]|jgi:hypothetical protein|nr:hypothetical protein [Nanoarchaeota archaeon]